MKPEIVIACYRPHEGKDEELKRILSRHIPTLRAAELITDRAAILMTSANGSYLEIFEWRTADSARQAHHHPEVSKVWEAIGEVADMPPIASLEESRARFPHFTPVTF